MARAEQLEAQQELAAAQHALHTQQLQQQQADLEAALQETRQRVADLQAQLDAAHAEGMSQQHSLLLLTRLWGLGTTTGGGWTESRHTTVVNSSTACNGTACTYLQLCTVDFVGELSLG